MRNHGWQPPFHPLQTVAIAVYCTLVCSFYVFFAPFLGTRTLKFVLIGVFTPLVGAVCLLYISCTWIDPADPRIYRSQEKHSLKKGAGTESSRHGDAMESETDLLYCSICNADISAQSKHCRACDKCVHGFDHHCRWLNNCVGTRNYKPFVALMVSCLLLLILEWTVGIVVMVRCFSDKTSFDEEIRDNLGRSFPRVAFIIVLVILTFLAFLATAPLTQLFCFHLILMHKGITTYDYILAVREENQEFWEENGGTSSTTTSPATSTDTGFSGYNSAASNRIVFCTPPRMFVNQDQNILALSDLEIGASKASGRKIIDSTKSKQKTAVGLNPWKLARVTTEDATRAAARARAKSSILLPTRPGGTEAPLGKDSDSSISKSSSAGEIRLASSSSRFRVPWSGPLGAAAAAADSDRHAATSVSSSMEGLPALPLEPRSPYRFCSPNDAYTGDPRASFPVPQGPYPAQFVFPRFPGDPGRSQVMPQVVESSSPDVVRISMNSDGYEASCGESGDDTSDTVGLSQSWTQPTWRPFANSPQLYKEEDVKPWVASFPSEASSMPDVVDSPAGQSVASSGSRVEANILKLKPELQHARLQQSSSPSTVDEDSPLRESSDFVSEDTTTTTTSYGEAHDRSSISSFFYTGPESVTFKATTSGRQALPNRMLVVNPIIGARPSLSRVTDDPKLLVETP